VRSVFEEIDAGWDAESKVVRISSSGEREERKGVYEEIDAGWDAESKVVCIPSSGEK